MQVMINIVFLSREKTAFGNMTCVAHLSELKELSQTALSHPQFQIDKILLNPFCLTLIRGMDGLEG